MSPGIEASWLAKGSPPQLLLCCPIHLGSEKLSFKLFKGIADLDGQIVPVCDTGSCVTSK